jgi:hypothetical protein
MSKSLKQKNQPPIITFLVINTCVLFAVTLGPNRVFDFLGKATKGDLALLGKLVAAPAVLSLLVGMIGWALPRDWKEILVFWRVGESRLPSSRAFSVLAAKDARINLNQLRDHLGAFPREPAKQTALWYGVYRKHCDEAPVEDANGAYLRYRDMSVLPPLLLVASVVLTIWSGASWMKFVLCAAIFLAEYLVVTQAARNAAKSLVTNVLAVESSAQIAERPN